MQEIVSLLYSRKWPTTVVQKTIILIHLKKRLSILMNFIIYLLQTIQLLIKRIKLFCKNVFESKKFALLSKKYI